MATGLRNTDMNPTTPTNSGSAMSQGGTFIRPGAIGWGAWGGSRGPRPDAAPENPGSPETRQDLEAPGNHENITTPENPATPAAIEHALSAAAKDPDRVTDLLDELSRGRLWLPLPDDRPVTDGSAVLLPIVTYLGAEFVPAFTSAQRLATWLGRTTGPAGQAGSFVPPQHQGESELSRLSSGDGPFAAMPHIVVPAAELAKRLPSSVGIALNPGAEASVPIYPEGVGYLSARRVVTDGVQIRVGR